MRRAGDRLRITAQLINAADGCHLWSQRFDRRMGDVFEIQEEIAQSIVEALRVKLTGRTLTRVVCVSPWYEAVSTALAAEVADSGIFVSTVCPGPVDTEFANVASNGAREKVIDGKSPKKVVEHCLKTVRRGKRIAVMAPKWKFKAFMSRFVGRYFFARYTYIHDKRPSK